MINIIQVIISIILITLILLQERSSGMSGIFGGGGGGGNPYQSRRGIEKLLFWGTITIGTIFVLLSLANLFFF